MTAREIQDSVTQVDGWSSLPLSDEERAAMLEIVRVCVEVGKEAGWSEAVEACAKICEKPFLPSSVGGDLIVDPYTAKTIASAIRALAAPGNVKRE